MSENNTSLPRLNDQILKYFNDLPKLREVRLIDENGEQKGVMPAIKALDLARSLNLDLIEIAPNAQPPVCKIIDYGKYKYQQSKKNKELSISQKQSSLKTLTLGVMIDEHDLKIKMISAMKFLRNGNKVKIIIRFKGREISYPELADVLLNKIIDATTGTGVIEKPASIDGKSIIMILAPKASWLKGNFHFSEEKFIFRERLNWQIHQGN